MWDRNIMVGKSKDAKPVQCCAPAAGCFGQLRATESYTGHHKRSAEDVASDWQSVAEGFYQLGYRNGDKAA